MVEETKYQKIVEWMEVIGKKTGHIEDRIHYLTEKVETLYEVVQEMRDDMRLIKRTVNDHDEQLQRLMAG